MKILLYPHKSLTTVCDTVEKFNTDLHKVLDEMKEIMRKYGGIGLAANQVGIHKRFFIMEALALNKKGKWVPKGEIYELINPIIMDRSDEYYYYREGCLSTPGIFGAVPDRRYQITLKAQDRDGLEHLYEAYELEAVCSAHELDHLNGVFFFDRLTRKDKRNANKRWQKQLRKIKS